MQEVRRPIEWREHNGHISQVYSSGLQYAFLTPDFKQHLPWVYCKDFLHDAIFSYLHGTNLSIYGYEYKPTEHPKPLVRRMRLLVTNKSDKDEFEGKVENSIDFVNQIEKAMEFPSLTRAFKCSDPPKGHKKCGVFLFSGSGDWLLAPPMISCYTLIVRCGFVHTKGVPFMETIDQTINGAIKPYQTEDAHQLQQAKSGIERLINVGYRNIFAREMRSNYPEKLDSGTMHHRFGIVSFATNVTKTRMPDWHKEVPNKVEKAEAVAAEA